jgi:hypothetical protein
LIDQAGRAAGRRAAVAAAVVLGAFAVCGAASAQDAGAAAPEPVLTPAEASAELAEALDAVTGAPELEPTDELRDLPVAIPYLEGRERRQARSLLARPPDGQGDIFGGNWPAGAVEEVAESDHFVTHWPEGLACNAPAQGCDEPDLADTAPANGVPDYIDNVIAQAEESFDVQNDDLGWPLPKPDGSRGGNSKTDVYVADICDETSNRCIFGYASPDDNSPECRQPPFRCFAYLVLDNDYQPDEFDYPSPDIPLQVTAAHEYNHILQFRLDTQQDGWMFESTATWSEEQVFPDADDWLFYVRAWRRQPQQPITKFGAGGGLRVYGSAVWNHWLDAGAGYGPQVVLESWEKSRKSKPKDFAVGAYDLGIKRNGGRGFADEFGRFAAATAEWGVPALGFPDGEDYGDVKRKGTLRPGDGEKVELDHAAYRLLRVKPQGRNRLKLRVRAPRGVATGIALVGREGGAETGDATIRYELLKRGGKEAVVLPDAPGFERITAVVANADARVRGFSGGDHDYVHDNERFRAGLR